MDEYIVDDQTYQVSEDMLEKFLEKYPGAKKKGGEIKSTPVEEVEEVEVEEIEPTSTESIPEIPTRIGDEINDISLDEIRKNTESVEVIEEPSFMQKVINAVNKSPFSESSSNLIVQEKINREKEIKEIEKRRIEQPEFIEEKNIFSKKIEELLNDPSILKEITKTEDNPEGISNFEFILPEELNGLGKNKDAYQDILKVIKPILLEDYPGPILEKDVDKLFKNILTKRATLEKDRRDTVNNVKAID